MPLCDSAPKFCPGSLRGSSSAAARQQIVIPGSSDANSQSTPLTGRPRPTCLRVFTSGSRWSPGPTRPPGDHAGKALVPSPEPRATRGAGKRLAGRTRGAAGLRKPTPEPAFPSSDTLGRGLPDVHLKKQNKNTLLGDPPTLSRASGLTEPSPSYSAAPLRPSRLLPPASRRHPGGGATGSAWDAAGPQHGGRQGLRGRFA
jgi:hypothetical protein